MMLINNMIKEMPINQGINGSMKFSRCSIVGTDYVLEWLQQQGGSDPLNTILFA